MNTPDATDQLTQLRLTLGKMELALGAIEESIVWTDGEGRVQWCNAPFARLVDRPRIQILGRPVPQLLPLLEHGVDLPEDAHPVRVMLRQEHDASGFYEYQKAKSGVFIEFRGKYLKLADGQVCAVVVVRDLSQVKQSEQTRLQSKALEAAANAIAITDSNGAAIWINAAFTRLTGYRLEEIYGKNLRLLKSGKHTEAFYRNLWETILAGKIWRGETVNRHKDGHLYTERQVITPVLDEKGLAAHFIAIKEDISSLKRIEEKLKNYQENLELMVESRTRELERTQKELVSKALQAARAQWAGIMLHNIGNAITPVAVTVEAMSALNTGQLLSYLDRCYGELKGHEGGLDAWLNGDPRGREVFSFMGELVGNLSENQLLMRRELEKITSAVSYIGEILTIQQDYAAGDRGTRERTDVNRLIEDAVRIQKLSLDKRSIRIVLELAPDLTLLPAEKNSLLQVFLNLIKNSAEAIDAMAEDRPAGTGTIRIRTRSTPSTLSVEVGDDGAGISPEARLRLFEFGVSGKGSSGMGLYYCRQVIEAHGGTLEIDSPGIGKGASVRAEFLIPVAKKE